MNAEISNHQYIHIIILNLIFIKNIKMDFLRPRKFGGRTSKRG